MRLFLYVCMVVLVGLTGCQQQERSAAPSQGVYPAPQMISPQQIENLRSIAKSNPKNAAAWTTLGNALMDSQRFNEAIEAYAQSLALDPKNVNVRVDMGTCYRNIGKPEIAVQEFRKGLAIEPNHINGHRNLGVVLAFDLNDRAGAIKEFEKYLALLPNAQDAGQIRAAIEDLKKMQ